uniref:ABC-type glutathione-S-conjugate transporter n=1 Tax=Strigamia maritima TaxID=126957 RepID=T1JBD6_STRMM
MAIDKFCGSVFWDEQQTWNTTNPDFSPCFHKTILVWVSCGVLWLFTPLEILYMTKKNENYIPWTPKNVFKLIINFILIILCVCEFTHFFSSELDHKVYAVDLWMPTIKGLTYCLAIILLIFDKKCGIHSSGVLFIFWLISSVTGIFTYRSYIAGYLSIHETTDEFLYTTSVTSFPLVVAQLVLASFSDTVIRRKQDPRACPLQYASFPSLSFFGWFDSLLWKGFRKVLTEKDIWTLDDDYKSKIIHQAFDRIWQQKNKEFDNMTKKKMRFLWMLWEINRFEFCMAFVLKIFADLLTFVSPLMLRQLIDFISNPEEPIWKGYMYTVTMFVASILATTAMHNYFFRLQCIGVRARAAVIAVVYRKSLKMSAAAKRSSTTGEIVNLMSVDAQRVMDVWPFAGYLLTTPLSIGLALYLIYTLLGLSVFGGLSIIILLIPLNLVLVRITSKLQTKLMALKDQRIKLTNEILNGMKILKLYAWEKSFQDQINIIRAKELLLLKKILYLEAVTNFIFQFSPFLIAITTFAAYVLSSPNNILDAAKAFVSINLFDQIRFPLIMVPLIFSLLVQAHTSLKRLDNFMLNEELDFLQVREGTDDNTALLIENGTFSWAVDDGPILRNINLRVAPGNLIAVVGTVGAGKSSLMSAILGEMEKISGKITRKGNLAYVSQQAWIQNATVCDNVLFGKPMNTNFYTKVIEACALKPDFEMLPGGDQTEIGEKGINLSGGQKQRVSLARAVYANTDIYLLDDPLSAVDAHVGKHIFDKVIGPKGELAGKTRILVTHGISYLPYVDCIVVINKGTISEVGSYKELLGKCGAFAEFIMTYLKEEGEIDELEAAELLEMQEGLLPQIENKELSRYRKLSLRISRALSSDEDSQDKITRSASISGRRPSSGRRLSRSKSTKDERHQSIPEISKKDAAVLIGKEQMESGSVGWGIYKYYFKSCGWHFFLIAITLFAFSWTSSVGSNIWLSFWSSDVPNTDGTQNIPLRNLRLGVYSGLGAGQVVFSLVAALILLQGTVRASSLLHSDMLTNILRSPMSFFDTTPLGRILNRFSRDVDVIDSAIPMFVRPLIDSSLQIIGVIAVICWGTPLFLIALIPLSAIYYFIQKVFINTSRQLKRMESVSRSPIFSHFSETLAGLSTIRAYKIQPRFIETSDQGVDYNNGLFYPFLVAKRWLAVRLELVGSLVVFCAALLAVIGRNALEPGTVGLSVSYALSVTLVLTSLVRNWTEVDTNSVSIERLKEYSELANEAPWELLNFKPTSGWPEEGGMTFQKYSTRYREGLDLVLKGITCNIHSGEKIGIVGRTGAGKSSLTLAMFRIIEAAEGSITIDNVNIGKIGLHDLRSRLTIIPQDPVLFFGSLRMNLDPFFKFSDDELWKALEHSHLKDFVSSLPAGLQHGITEGGENLSVGQRQLLCLARALLRKSKVLILDEATAAVDLETDDLIQATIRKEFVECTVITIAHRLNTIMDSNRDVTKVWNTSNPDFPHCFQNMVLVLAPNILLWVLLPLEIMRIKRSNKLDKKFHIPWTCFNIFKNILSAVLMFISIAFLVLNANEFNKGNAFTVDVLSSAVESCTYFLVLILGIVHKKSCIHSSAVLFVYWLLKSFGGIFILTSTMLRALSEHQIDDMLLFTLTIVTVNCTFASMVLNAFADTVISLNNILSSYPEKLASPVSIALYTYFDKLAWTGYKRELKTEDLWALEETYQCYDVYSRFDVLSSREKQRNKKEFTTNVLKIIWKMNKWKFFVAILLKWTSDILDFVGPLMLKQLVNFVSNDEPSWHGYVYVLSIYLAGSLSSICQNNNFHVMQQVGLRARAAVISAIYRKALKMSISAKKTSTVGEIVTLMSVDSQRVMDMWKEIHHVTSLPLIVGIASYLLWGLLGPSALVGVGVLSVMIPINLILAGKLSKLQEQLMKHKDHRTKIINEVLSGVKILKLYAWEMPFFDSINKIRNFELMFLKRVWILNAVTTFLLQLTPSLILMTTFATFVLVDDNNILDATNAFVSLSLFEMIRIPLNIVPTVIALVVQAFVSVKRINKFLAIDEIDVCCNDKIIYDPIEIQNATFSWGVDEESVLHNVFLTVPEGALFAVVGAVGSGKSSMLAAILGEMVKLNGTVNTQNASLRNNILFGKSYNKKKYRKVVEACALVTDFDILPAGDETEIGEKGVNLSGGQRQRVSLARAVYNDAGIYLLDDPLSAVDAHVGKHIFEHVIGPDGLLNEKTRVFVTHGIAYLPYVTSIVVINEGKILENGSYQTLLKKGGGFSEFLMTYLKNEDGLDEVEREELIHHQKELLSEIEDVDVESHLSERIIKAVSLDEIHSSTEESKLRQRRSSRQLSVKNEINAVGKLTQNERMEMGKVETDVYIHYIKSIGICLFIVSLTILGLAWALSVGSNIWLSIWSGDKLNPDGTQNTALRNLRLGVFSALGFGQCVFAFFASIALAYGSVYASKHLHNTMLMRKLYIEVSRQLKRLESVSRSPIYSHFSETITGLTTIRAFHCEEAFLRKLEDKVDYNHVIYYSQLVAKRWLGIRLEVIGQIIVLSAGIFAVTGRDTMDPGLVGLSLSYALTITLLLTLLVRNWTDFETNIVSVERIKQYTELQTEASCETLEDGLSSEWPRNGAVDFKKYSTCYREGMDLVLNQISCNIKGEEKIGIVGRTGAGKSSLTLALFRLIEGTEGVISIDGIDIGKIGLHDLRSRLTIIPQDPVLFCGSLRMNLDPFDKYSDRDIWRALEQSHLKDLVISLQDGLDYDIAEGGENLSVGQRQLVCLARALLRKTKILVLDEATAAIDLETDDLIQATIRKEFADCTVITIAHRLKTIMDNDRVMVLQNGTIIEFDSPVTLLRREDCAFYSMAKDAGLDLNQVWNTTNPDFPHCFQKIVLVSAPDILLWILLPFGIISIKRIFILELVHKRTCIHSSAILFLYWLLKGIGGIIVLRSALLGALSEDYVEDELTFILTVITVNFIFASMILNAFSDTVMSFKNILGFCPKKIASPLSLALYTYFDKLAWTGFKRKLEAEDLWTLEEQYQTYEVYSEFDTLWCKEKQKHKKESVVNIFKIIWKMNKWEVILATFAKWMSDILGFVSPLMLKELINFVSSDEPSWKGYVYAITIYLAATLSSIFQNNHYHRMQQIGIRARAAVISAVYRKALKMSNSAKKTSTVGEIVTLMSVDSQRVMDMWQYIGHATSMPLIVCLALYLLWGLLGPSVLVGVGVIILMIPINLFIAGRTSKLQSQLMRHKDHRTKLMNEILSGVKILKLYAWEMPFINLIDKIRNLELVSLKNEPIMIQDASFSWGDDEESVLHNIFLTVPDGALFAVVGAVGSGKSSMLAAILGEMVKLNGTVNTQGSIAYVSQQAWIQNASLRNNILFGKPYNHQKYQKIINACALVQDFEILPAGDETEIGEKGINLSGGQKQRVSLARAVYNDADIYLLDDPLSAVDAHVGKHIFEHVIGPDGLLNEKTRVFVTHGIAYLPYVTSIMVLGEGNVLEIGSYQTLLKKGGGFSEFLMTYLKNEDDLDEVEMAELLERQEELLSEIEDEDVKRRVSQRITRAMSSDDEAHSTTEESKLRKRQLSRQQSVKTEAKLLQPLGKLTQEEQMEVGKVDMNVYIHYIKSIGLCLFIISFAVLAVAWALSVGSNIWLSIWSGDKPNPDGTQDTDLRDLRLGVYGSLAFGQCVFALVASVALAYGTTFASKHLHNTMLMRVLRSPMTFFDTTPLGRIINRFSRDIDVTDYTIPSFMRAVLDGIFQLLGTIVVISLGNAFFLVVLAPLMIVYYLIQRLYIESSRQLKRLEAVSRSPIYSLFSETVNGLTTIRAFRCEDAFLKKLEDKVDYNHVIYYPILIAKRWLGIRLEAIGQLIVLSAGIFAVTGRDTMDPGLVGLSISYALTITVLLTWLVRNWTEFETNIVSVERMKEYTELETEASWKIPGLDLSSEWPQTGAVDFKKYSTCYREGLDLVLKQISCNIRSEEKVGIVGRTGAGKSSLTLALFRLIERTEGVISIDGIDIGKIGLHDLRSRLTIIPQDPVLFCGSLRMNLDPFDKYSDTDIWRALEHSHLKDFVTSLPAALNHEISEGGENLSVGQRQLVCLARALLRKTKVLILDEATAAIDLETDDLIQATIRKEFADCTIITIAHRLNTIMDSDRVMVLQNGTIVEFDSPFNAFFGDKSIGVPYSVDFKCLDLIPLVGSLLISSCDDAALLHNLRKHRVDELLTLHIPDDDSPEKWQVVMFGLHYSRWQFFKIKVSFQDVDAINMASLCFSTGSQLQELKRQWLKREKVDVDDECDVEDETVRFIELTPNNLSKIEKGILKNVPRPISEKEKWSDELSQSDNLEVMS